MIELPTFWTILLDIAIWFVIHMGVVYFAVRIPIRFFNPRAFLYRTRNWERSGAFYQKFFKIKRWKERAPDGAGLLRGGALLERAVGASLFLVTSLEHDVRFLAARRKRCGKDPVSCGLACYRVSQHHDEPCEELGTPRPLEQVVAIIRDIELWLFA